MARGISRTSTRTIADLKGGYTISEVLLHATWRIISAGFVLLIAIQIEALVLNSGLLWHWVNLNQQHDLRTEPSVFTSFWGHFASPRKLISTQASTFNAESASIRKKIGG